MKPKNAMNGVVPDAFNQVMINVYLIPGGTKKYYCWPRKDEEKVVEYFTEIIKGKSKQTIPRKYDALVGFRMYMYVCLLVTSTHNFTYTFTETLG